jgi:hypothetical protein
VKGWTYIESMATRLAITPRNKEGQVHYYQADQPEP